MFPGFFIYIKFILQKKINYQFTRGIIRKGIAVFILLAMIFTKLIAQQPRNIDTAITKQKDIIDVLLKVFKINLAKADTTRQNKKVQFSLVPTAGGAPGGGTAIVTAVNAAFYTGPRTTTSLSTVSFYPWFSFNGKFVLPLRHLIWLPQNKYLWKGDTRYMRYPQETWGLGGNNEKDEYFFLDYDYIRFYQILLKRVGKNLLLGGGYSLDRHYDISVNGDTLHISEIPLFDYNKKLFDNSTSSGPVVSFAVDTRGNAINPQGGFYFAADYRINLKEFGSTDDWQSIYIDFRKYYSFSQQRQNVLAFWGHFWGIVNGNAPYLDLPSIGWDYQNNSGRGFQQNRYRGKRLIYFESEYRRDISANGLWGFVLFANMHSVSEYLTDRFVYWHPAAGAGVRLKFNKISRTNIGLDFGVSKDYFSIDISLGEVF